MRLRAALVELQDERGLLCHRRGLGCRIEIGPAQRGFQCDNGGTFGAFGGHRFVVKPTEIRRQSGLKGCVGIHVDIIGQRLTRQARNMAYALFAQDFLHAANGQTFLVQQAFDARDQRHIRGPIICLLYTSRWV